MVINQTSKPRKGRRRDDSSSDSDDSEDDKVKPTKAAPQISDICQTILSNEWIFLIIFWNFLLKSFFLQFKCLKNLILVFYIPISISSGMWPSFTGLTMLKVIWCIFSFQQTGEWPGCKESHHSDRKVLEESR